jgi:hypothetical protein
MLPKELVASYHGYKTDTNKFTTWLWDTNFRDMSHLHSAESLRLSSNIRQERMGAKEIQTKGLGLTATPASNFRIGLAWGNKPNFQHFSTLECSNNFLFLDISCLMPAHRPNSTTYRHQNITDPQDRQLTPTRFSFSSQIPHQLVHSSRGNNGHTSPNNCYETKGYRS